MTTTDATTAPPPTRVRSTFVRDMLIVFRRAMRLALRNPVWTVMGLAQPILYLVLFGPLLKPIAAAVGVQNAYQLFVPGLLVQLGMFGALFVGFGLLGEWRDGVIEAERVTPAPRSALVLGRVMRDVVVILVQGIVLTAVAVPFGLRAPLGGLRLSILRRRTHPQERGRPCTPAQRHRATAATAVRDPAAHQQPDGPRLAQPGLGHQPAQARRERDPGRVPRRADDPDRALGLPADGHPGRGRRMGGHPHIPPRGPLSAAAPTTSRPALIGCSTCVTPQ